MNKEQIIDTFVTLGERLIHFGDDAQSRQIIHEACIANSWFSEFEIRHAISAICSQMLTAHNLQTWLDRYPSLPVTAQRNILVVMAGNIPLVGFFDLLCVVASGNRCLVKPSSKDRVLMQYIIDQLCEIEPAVAAEIYDGVMTPDAVIATGSDNAVRHFQAEYGTLPMLLRGSRSSVAILTGEEAEEEIQQLCNDIYLYSGLGCRNISLIFAPEDYDIEGLATVLRKQSEMNIGLLNNYRQRRAILSMSGVAHCDLGHSLLVEEPSFPSAISQINIARYRSIGETAVWLATHDTEIQCVACNDKAFIKQYAPSCAPLRRATPLGTTQHPTLADYPDALDVMEWAKNLA